MLCLYLFHVPHSLLHFHPVIVTVDILLTYLLLSHTPSCGTSGSIGSSRLLGRETGGDGVLWGVGGSSSNGGLGRGNHSDDFFSAPVHPQTQTDFMNYLFDSALQEDEVIIEMVK